MGSERNNRAEGRLDRVQSLVRALSILDVLARRGRLALADVSREVDLPRSTAHRLLTTMESLRYVLFDRTRNCWSIGPQSFTVGYAFGRDQDERRPLSTELQSLAEGLRHSVNLAAPRGGAMCYLAAATVEGSPPTTACPGAVLPLHTTASGKAVLARFSRSELENFLDATPLGRRTSRTILSRSRLYDDLNLVRGRGYSIDDEEHEEGLRCVGAAVLDAHGRPLRAISVSASPERLTKGRIAVVGSELAAAARRMEADAAF